MVREIFSIRCQALIERTSLFNVVSKKRTSFGFSLQKSAASLLFSFALILPEC